MKINKVILLLIGLVVFNACVEDDDFNVPSVDVIDPVIDGNIIDINAVLGVLAQSNDDIVTFQDTNNFMEGYVISSDEGGNFFEEIVLQNRTENPTAGIVVQIDVNPLFTVYDFGRKVYVKLDGLSVAVDNGVVQLGRREGSDLAKISASEMTETILRTSEVATIVPLEVNINEFSNDLENLFIRLPDVQFSRFDVLGESPLTFASEANDQFDGERLLESCSSSSSVIMSTSTFSDFKSLLLPTNRGTLDGVLTRDFFDEFFTIVINSPSDINFGINERCDPIELTCGIAGSVGANNLFADDFETQTTNSPISGNGWTNFIEAGTQQWEAFTSGGANASLGVSARVGSFNSGDASTIAWLISPAIDLDAQDGETLNFKTSNSFDDGSEYELLFSNDWDGVEANITSATWGVLPDATLVTDDDFFGDWIDSGIVDLSCGSGTIYIAFKYVGSGNPDFDGTLELDEFSIDSN